MQPLKTKHLHLLSLINAKGLDRIPEGRSSGRISWQDDVGFYLENT